MNIISWLSEATDKLKLSGITTARLDCLVLLEDFVGKDRSWLLANPEYELKQIKGINEQVRRRASHEPLSYIRGKSEFYGRTFVINKHTLEPRPETETMIELALDMVDKKYLIIDIGTGSGAIAITMKLQRPDLHVIATDIDEKCIETASKNAEILNANVTFLHMNLIENMSQKVSDRTENVIICANLPYVPDKYKVNEAAKFEPRHAIFGGKDGLDLYRELFQQISSIKYLVSSIFTESLPFQHPELANIAENAGYKLHQTEDFIQVFVPATN